MMMIPSCWRLKSFVEHSEGGVLADFAILLSLLLLEIPLLLDLETPFLVGQELRGLWGKRLQRL